MYVNTYPERVSILKMTERLNMIKCVVCSQDVTSRRGLAFHIKKHNIESVDKYLEIYPDQIQYVNPKDNSLITCPICGRYNMKQLGQHITGTHKITHDEFMKLYPNQKMFIDEISDRCRKASKIGVKKYYENKAANPEKYEEMIKKRTYNRIKNNPDIVEKIKLGQSNSELYQTTRSNVRELWKNPEYRKMQSEKCKKQHRDGLTDIVIKKSYKRRSITVTIDNIVYTMRSSWEVRFAQLLSSLNIPFEYENIKIKYFYNNNFHTYYPDFRIKDTNIVFEVKPYKLIQDDRNKAKQRYTVCSGYDLRYITEYELKNIDSINFKGCF